MNPRMPQIREAIASHAKQGTGITSYPRPKATMDPPCIFVGGHSGELKTMGGDRTLDLDLLFLAGSVQSDMDDWADKLDAFVLGPNDIFTAFADGLHIGTAFFDLTGEHDSYGKVEWNGVDYWSVRTPGALTL